jgi:hypothetical protein
MVEIEGALSAATSNHHAVADQALASASARFAPNTLASV